jgi:hypothetical protein
VQPVHHRFDDLQHREGRETVPDQRAENAPPFQLRKQRKLHGPRLRD